MPFQETLAQKEVPPAVIFGLSLLFVFLILAARYESWARKEKTETVPVDNVGASQAASATK
jgi:hypothetical protein